MSLNLNGKKRRENNDIPLHNFQTEVKSAVRMNMLIGQINDMSA